MREEKFYTAGEFAKKAGVTIRTIRFYDNKGLLKPSKLTETGYRLYTDLDFAKLQKILTLKYLGFSLEDITMFITSNNTTDYLKHSLQQQKQIVRNKINHMERIEKSIEEAEKIFERDDEFLWEKIINIIHLLNMEKDLVDQYKDSTNVDIRISLHNKYSVNKQGWFNWMFENYTIPPNPRMLELGCGNGELWKCNGNNLPCPSEIILSDISNGMLNDAKERLKSLNKTFKFETINSSDIPYPNESFHIIIANHMLFYVNDREKTLSEIKRVLKPGGYFYCSTYGKKHMKKIEDITKGYDSRISLSEVNLYELFGLENGTAQLEPWFQDITLHIHKDSLIVDDYKPLLDYILSCHGNEHEILKNRYEDFETYIRGKFERTGTLTIEKEAGMFICKKS